MMRAPVRTAPETETRGGGRTPPAPPEAHDWLMLALGAGALIVILVAGIGFWRARHRPTSSTCTPVGAYQTCLPQAWLGFWQEYRGMLGDPEGVAPAEGFPACLTTIAYRACTKATANPRLTLTDIELLPLGSVAAVRAGFKPEIGLSAPGIVTQYLELLERNGINTRVWIGAVITPAFCGTDTGGHNGACVVFTQYQVLRYPMAATDPQQVSRDLGIWTVRP